MHPQIGPNLPFYDIILLNKRINVSFPGRRLYCSFLYLLCRQLLHSVKIYELAGWDLLGIPVSHARLCITD